MAAVPCDDHSQFLTLECLGEADIVSQITSLDRRIFPTPFRINGQAFQGLGRRNKVLLYARALQNNKEVVLGYVLYSTNSVKVHVEKIAVRPANQSRGVGSTLLLAALQKGATERRVQEAHLTVAIGNAPALRVYRRLGFKDGSLIEDYYGAGRHGLRMSCDLNATLWSEPSVTLSAATGRIGQ